MNTRKILTALFLLTFTLAACSPQTAAQPPADTASPPEATLPPTLVPTEDLTIAPMEITLDTLQNMTYQGIYDEVTPLVNGVYEGEPVSEGSALRPMVTLIPEFVALGDLNGDELEDAVVVLTENSGGSGTFVYLAAVINDNGALKNIATLLLGDRVVPGMVSITDQRIVIEMLTHSDTDPLCCPTVETRNTYVLKPALQMTQ